MTFHDLPKVCAQGKVARFSYFEKFFFFFFSGRGRNFTGEGSHSIKFFSDKLNFNPFRASDLFLCPLKTPLFSDVFKRYRKRPRT